ncbi:MAG TPA: DUF983 domain-containing protein [Xanthobacteraceae bacterium]|nr:DUF983 domain-containing protein [Xanthobacteraceae bacterium]
MAEQTPSLGTSILRGVRGRCPRCGEGKMFAGFLTVSQRCERCGLDYGFADSGDGPAVFVILLAGLIVAGSALVTEAVVSPPLWVHALLWGPLAVIVCVGPLRPLKGVLISLQYRFQAAEGRLERRP